MDALKNIELRLQKYKDTGNTEFLVDIANFAMLEFMHPSIPLVLGIIFLVVSMVIKYNIELRRSICTEQVSAVIAGVTKHNIYTIRMVQILKYTLLYTIMFMVEASIMCQLHSGP